MKLIRLLFLGLITVAFVSSGAPSADAQSDANKTSLARRLFKEGMAAAAKDDWETARARFYRAHKLAPDNLQTIFNLATSAEKTGNLVEASEYFRLYVTKTRYEDDPQLEELKKSAAESLASLESRIPTLNLKVIGLSPGDKVRLDDAEFPADGLNLPFPVNSGAHKIFVVRLDKEIAVREIELKEGEAKEETIVVPIAVTPKEDPKGMTLGSQTEQPKQESSGVFSSPWFWTGVAVVLVGAGGGYYYATEVYEPSPTSGNGGPAITVF